MRPFIPTQDQESSRLLPQTALNDFFAATVTSEDIAATFLPTFEKMLLRSPEVALSVIASFFTSLPATSFPSPAVRAKLLPAVASPAKSTNPTTRAASIHLFTVLFASSTLSTENDVLAAAKEVYAPLKAGKTSSPDHRTTLFMMLAPLPASPTLSADLVALTLSLLPKEFNDLTIASMMRVVALHLPSSLAAGSALTAPQLAALIKGMQEPKPTIRRSLVLTVGAVLWSLESEGDKVGEAAKAFAVGMLPALETALKTVTANPLNSPAGPLEGYVAVAALKGRMGKWGVKKIGRFPVPLPFRSELTHRHADDFISANATMQTILITGAKPTFLLWDKVYRKITSADDEAWLTCALEAILIADEDKFVKDQALRFVVLSSLVAPADSFSSRRTAFAHTLIHVGIESLHFESRQGLIDLVQRLNVRGAKLLHLIMREGLRSWLLQVRHLAFSRSDRTNDPHRRRRRKASPSPSRTTRRPLKTEPLESASSSAPSLRLANRRRSTTARNSSPTSSFLRTTLDWEQPRQGSGSPFSSRRTSDLRRSSRSDFLCSSSSSGVMRRPVFRCVPPLPGSSARLTAFRLQSTQFAQAAYQAATTLAFVSPKLVVPKLFAQLEDDLSVQHLAFIGPNEYGIWATPEGVAFIDGALRSVPCLRRIWTDDYLLPVLAAAKPKTAMSHKNSKEREIEIWEAELREALARKKPTVASLSKADRILLERQLAKESVVRKEMAEALGRLRRGFALLLCLVDSKAELVREYLATMVKDVLAVIVLRPATLVASEAFATYQVRPSPAYTRTELR